MKKCSTSLILREIQIKTTMRYQLTVVRMAKINNKERTNVDKVAEKGGLYRTVGGKEDKLMQPLWKTLWRFLKNLKVELPYGPATAVPGI